MVRFGCMIIPFARVHAGRVLGGRRERFIVRILGIVVLFWG